jgi:hypothetical protein
MLKIFARFRLPGSRRLAPGLRSAFPANDNLPTAHRAARVQSQRQALACRWSVTGNGTRLACLWQPEGHPSSPDRLKLQGDEQAHPRMRRDGALQAAQDFTSQSSKRLIRKASAGAVRNEIGLGRAKTQTS